MFYCNRLIQTTSFNMKKHIVHFLIYINILLLIQKESIFCNGQQQQNNTMINKNNSISLTKYISMMDTECQKEFNFDNTSDTTQTQEEEQENINEIIKLWNNHIEFEWKRADMRDTKYNNTINDNNYPFIVCDDTAAIKPIDKMNRLINYGLSSSNIMIVSSSSSIMQTNSTDDETTTDTNTNSNTTSTSETCFLIYTKSSWCKDIIINELNLNIIPVSYAMKILSGSIDMIQELLFYNDSTSSSDENDFGDINNIDTPQVDNDGSLLDNEEQQVKLDNITSDYIDIMLCPGIIINKTISEEIMKQEVIDYLESSIRNEVLWFMKENEQSQSSSSSSQHNNKRQEFWYNLLSNDNNDNISQCNAVYDKLHFEFQSIPIDDNITISTMSIDFRTLEKALLSHNYDNDNNSIITKEERSEIIQLTKVCTQILLVSISAIPEVCSIQTRPKYEIKNHNAQWLIQTGVDGVTPWYDLGLNGTGEVIAVSDTGISLDHCYFSDGYTFNLPRNFGVPLTLNMNHRKVVQYDDYVNSMDMNYGHGTHVAATAVGCKPDGTGISKGIAFGAKLAFLDIGFQDGRLATPGIMRLLNTGRPYAKIHSASWGSSLPVYGIQSWLMDSYIYNQNDELLLLFAAGNDGHDNAASTVGEPATAKNIIAVGSSHSIGSDATRDMLGPAYIASFSSRGPTRDGRTKPDILAPGKWISSAAARNDISGECDPPDGQPPSPNNVKDGLVSFQGTSMSTPIVAGAAALIRQYLREGYYPTGERNETNTITNPSASLIKGILLNGAQYMKGVDNEMKGVHPVKPYDNTQNMGRISLVDSLYIKGKSNVQTVFKDRVPIFNGNTKYFEITIDTSGGCTNPTFSAMLVWTDRPALPGCLDCLINDLDLYIQKNNDKSITYYPNGLSTKDSKNNAERIRLTDVKNNDNITMYVDASNLMTVVQSFSIIASGCMGQGEGNTINMKEGDVFANDDSAEHRKKNILMGVFIPVGLIAVGAIGYYIYNQRRLRLGY